jgi:hypothetical protein
VTGQLNAEQVARAAGFLQAWDYEQDLLVVYREIPDAVHFTGKDAWDQAAIYLTRPIEEARNGE